jgi:hypothetical protein
MRGLKAVLVGCGNMADDVEWPPGATDQSTKTLRDLRARFPILRFTAAPEPIANSILQLLNSYNS